MVSYAAREQASYASAGGVAEEVLSCIRTVVSFNGQSKEVTRYVIVLFNGQSKEVTRYVVVLKYCTNPHGD